MWGEGTWTQVLMQIEQALHWALSPGPKAENKMEVFRVPRLPFEQRWSHSFSDSVVHIALYLKLFWTLASPPISLLVNHSSYLCPLTTTPPQTGLPLHPFCWVTSAPRPLPPPFLINMFWGSVCVSLSFPVWSFGGPLFQTFIEGVMGYYELSSHCVVKYRNLFPLTWLRLVPIIHLTPATHPSF